jgi:NADH:ubiquinone oxidoreductase subunit 2 (subunit N)
VFALIFGGITFFFVAVLDYYSWLIGDLILLNEIRFAGVLLIASGGFGAVFQRDLGRLLGYAVMIEVGYGLLAVTFQDSILFYGMLGPRIVALSVWALGLSILNSHVTDLAYSTVQGMARKFPFAGAAVLIANFSLAGLPLLASFPLLVTVWKELGSFSAASMIWSFLGSIGLFAAGLRSFAVLIMGPEDLPWDVPRKLSERLFLAFGILFLFFLGIFPSTFGQLYTTLVGVIEAQIP